MVAQPLTISRQKNEIEVNTLSLVSPVVQRIGELHVLSILLILKENNQL